MQNISATGMHPLEYRPAGSAPARHATAVSANLHSVENTSRKSAISSVKQVLTRIGDNARHAFVWLRNLVTCRTQQEPDTATFTVSLGALRHYGWTSTCKAAEEVASLLGERQAAQPERWQSAIKMLRVSLDLFRAQGVAGMGASTETREKFEKLLLDPVVGKLSLLEVEQQLEVGARVLDERSARDQLAEFTYRLKLALAVHATDINDNAKLDWLHKSSFVACPVDYDPPIDYE